MFIVVEGPNGVGKTTVCSSLTNRLGKIGVESHSTAEPSRTPLGEAIRELEASMPAEALALSCAADRYDHLTREINRHLEAGRWVICDRYVPSSLVLQRVDGLSLEWIWSLNSKVVRPDLTVYLEHDPATIRSRLSQRGRRSRFETLDSTEIEIDFYREAHDFLGRVGWRQSIIDCRQKDPEQIADEIIIQTR